MSIDHDIFDLAEEFGIIKAPTSKALEEAKDMEAKVLGYLRSIGFDYAIENIMNEIRADERASNLVENGFTTYPSYSFEFKKRYLENKVRYHVSVYYSIKQKDVLLSLAMIKGRKLRHMSLGEETSIATHISQYTQKALKKSMFLEEAFEYSYSIEELDKFIELIKSI